MGESVFRDPAPHRFGHAAKFGVGATFDVIVALQFQRDIGRPALGAFDKAIVERGHSSWRIYTKSVSNRCGAAGWPRKNSAIRSSRLRAAWVLAAFLPLRWLCGTHRRRKHWE